MEDEKVSKTEARQGVELKQMRYVLGASLILAVTALGGVLIAFV
jgi:hypothetical protein